MGPLTLARWLLYRGYNDLGKEGSPHLKTEEEKSVFATLGSILDTQLS